FNVAVPIGTRGLYITVTESATYSHNSWRVPVPNNRSSSYTTYYNAYQAALTNRDVQIAAAQAEVDRLEAQEGIGNGSSLTSAQLEQARAQITQAQASVQSAQARLLDKVITAPFSGRVGQVSIEVGEAVTPGQTVLTLVTAGDYEVALQVPE